jgi:hypothetical protein
LVLTWCCFLLTDWILLFSWFFRISHLFHDWRPSFCLLCLSTTGFCFIILQRRSRSVHSWNGIIFAYDALVVVLLLLGQSCLLLFSSFFFISLVYYLKCLLLHSLSCYIAPAYSHQVAPVGSSSHSSGR